MTAHNGHPNPPEFPIDECRRVLMDVDIRASGWDLHSCKLSEELRLAAIADQHGIWHALGKEPDA